MADIRTITYPADAAQRLADRLCDNDWNLPQDEALETATDIVTDVTMAVDKLRALEAREAGLDRWVRADVVKPGDQVLLAHGALPVTHSQPAASGEWLLRFEHGVLYLNPAAPVALVGVDTP